MRSKRKARLLLTVVAVFSLLDLGVLVRDAAAVVGRPLTPVSYAGVARRTTRRAVAANTTAYPGYTAYPAPVGW